MCSEFRNFATYDELVKDICSFAIVYCCRNGGS